MRKAIGGGLVVVLLLGLGAAVLAGPDDYRLRLVVPSAAQLTLGSPVWINGVTVGQVDELAERDGKAVVTVSLSGPEVPLHEGTTSRIEWKSVLGERVVTIYPGPARNLPIPSGAMYTAQSDQIEVDQVLAALDEPTRARMSSMLRGLDELLRDRQSDLRETLRTAGPTVSALGEILRAVGQDGPAIRQLVTELHELTGPLARRQDDVAAVVRDLTALTGSVAEAQAPLAAGLAELPGTLDTARDTLDRVPPAAAATTPLLDELRPATDRLPAVAAELSPAMRRLRPVATQLGPTLRATQALLGETPDLLDSGHQVFPQIAAALDGYQPALDFLRPYTPELAGWLTSWGQGFAGYDAHGHFWGIGLAAGSGGLDDHLGPLPGERVEDRPAPGALVGQPWTDASRGGNR